jgi:hypothetical protein
MTIGNTKVPMLKSPYNPFNQRIERKTYQCQEEKNHRKKAVYDKLTRKLGIESLKVHIRVVH